MLGLLGRFRLFLFYRRHIIGRNVGLLLTFLQALAKRRDTLTQFAAHASDTADTKYQ